MTPLLPIGIAAAGYLAFRKDGEEAEKQKEFDPLNPHTLELNKAVEHGLLVESSMVADGNFSITGAPPKQFEHAKAPDVGGILAQITGTVGAVVGAVGIVASVGTAAGITAAGAVTGGLIAVAILVIIGFVVISCFLIYNELDGISKGRYQYMVNLLALADSIEGAVLPSIAAGTTVVDKDNPSISKVTILPGDEEKISKVFAYAATRGFNRAQLAFIIHNYHSAFNPVDNNHHVNYWADRSRCIPEEAYVTKPIKTGHLFGAWWIPDTNEDAFYIYETDSVEEHLFGSGNFDSAFQDLNARGLMTNETIDAADFVGRALGAQNILNHHWTGGDGVFSNDTGIVLAINDVVTNLVVCGVIGHQGGFPEEYAPGIWLDNYKDSELVGAVAHLHAQMDINAQTVKDTPGGSGLVWYFRESQDAGKTILRFE